MPKLLIIDDEDDFRKSISERFQLRGYDNIALPSGKDIVKVLKEYKDIDVVILDLKMPDISGDEVLKLIKATKPEVQVIILTGFGSTESAVELAKHDAFNYLQKPVDYEKLIKIVEDARTKARLLMAEKDDSKEKINVKKMVLWSTISVVLGLIIALIPAPESLPSRAQHFLGLLTTIILLWVTEAIPIGLTAFLAGGGLILFGIQSPTAAWTQYANPAVMFVLMIIMFGVILNEVGIAKRILNTAIRIGGTNVFKFSLFIALVSSFSSSIFHDATITIIFLFAIIPVFLKMGITPDKTNNFSKFFTILIPLSASAGGFGTILGGGRNPIAVDYIEKNLGVHVGFLDWIVIQMPMVLLVSLATFFICWILINPKYKTFPGEIKVEELPPMSKNEKGVAVIFILAFIFWTLSDFTALHVSVVSAFAIILICGFGFVNFKNILQKFSWEAWLVFGAGVSLGAAMLDTGAGKWLAEQFFPLIENQVKFVQYFGIAFFGSFISSFMSNSAAVALCSPILDPLSVKLGLSRIEVILSLPVTTSFIMLVIGCPPTIISYSTGYFSQFDFVKVAIPWAIIAILVVVFSMAIYWPFILPALGYTL